jgi:ankyrin repeat protein
VIILIAGCPKHGALPALMEAIRKDDLPGVKASLGENPDLEPVCAENEVCKPLAYAAEHGDLEIIKLLLGAGADPNGKNGTGDTAFMAAEDAFSLAGKSRAEVRAVQEYLLRGGTDPNQANSLGNTAFMCMAAAGDTGMMKIALDYGANVNNRNVDGWTPLMAAAQFGQNRTALWLLQHGADKEVKDKLGKTAHDYAVWFNHDATAKLLQN